MRIKTSPTEGLLLEIGYIVATGISAISLMKGETGIEILPVCLICGFLSLVNLPQLTRFKHSDDEKKFLAAFDILKDETKEMNIRQNALETIIECANNGYEPAKQVLEQLQACQQK